MDFWMLVDLYQHLNEPMHGSSLLLFKNRMMGYSYVIILINTGSM